MAIKRIYFRRDTTLNWQNVNPILNSGEPAYDIDLKLWTVGDGLTRYLELPKIPIDILSRISSVGLPDGVVSGSNQVSSSFVNITGDTMTGNLNVTGDVNISGILTATEFHSDIVSGSVIYESGSTKFGDTADDTHEFTGSLKVEGTISGSFIGDGSGLSGVTSYTDTDTLNYINSIAVVSGSVISSYTDLINIPANIISGSSQLDGTTVNNLTITNGLSATIESIATERLYLDAAEFRTSYQIINNAGSPQEVATIPTGSYDAFYFDYVIKNGVNLRAGTLIAVHDGVNVNIIDNTTTDLGNTSDIVMSADLDSGFIRLLAITNSGTWIVKTIIHMI